MSAAGRPTSEFWVSALMRRARADGVMAVLRHRGDETAGAIFVVVDRLDGTADLHVPLPQSEVAEGEAGTRRFETVLARVAPAEIDGRIASESRFDPDVWVIEIEDRAGRSFIEPPPRDPNAPEKILPVWPPKL